jgi:hypothetical protein
MFINKKLLLSSCVFASIANVGFAEDAVPSSAQFPDTYQIEGATWYFSGHVFCDMTKKEGSEWDTVFNVEYKNPKSEYFTYKQPYIYEYSCQSTLRNNKNFKPDGNGYARCIGSPSHCTVYKAG